MEVETLEIYERLGIKSNLSYINSLSPYQNFVLLWFGNSLVLSVESLCHDQEFVGFKHNLHNQNFGISNLIVPSWSNNFTFNGTKYKISIIMSNDFTFKDTKHQISIVSSWSNNFTFKERFLPFCLGERTTLERVPKIVRVF